MDHISNARSMLIVILCVMENIHVGLLWLNVQQMVFINVLLRVRDLKVVAMQYSEGMVDYHYVLVKMPVCLQHFPSHYQQRIIHVIVILMDHIILAGELKFIVH